MSNKLLLPIPSRCFYLFYYCNVNSKEWQIIKDYYFFKSQYVTLFILKDYYLPIYFPKHNQTTLFMLMSYVETVFYKKNFNYFDYQINSVLKNKLILNFVFINNFFYNSLITDKILYLSKRQLFKNCIKYFNNMSYFFFPIILKFFIECYIIINIKSFIVINSKILIYNLFLYL